MENKKCVVCGQEFSPSYGKQQCCGRKCAAIMRAQQVESNKIVKYCATCGKEMLVNASQRDKKYCCRECADK